MGAGERQAQGELGLGQPAIELVPEQPARDGLGRKVGEEDAVPRHDHVVEPHLAVELVEAAAERGGEGIGIARRALAADHRDAAGIDRHDEGRALAVEHRAVDRADIDVLGEGRAGVHADLAAHHDARLGAADDLERDPIGGILAQPIADRRRARREGEEAPATRDLRAICLGVGGLLGRRLVQIDRMQDAERDQMAIGGRVGDVAGAEEGRGREALAHAHEIIGGARHEIVDRPPFGPNSVSFQAGSSWRSYQAT